MPTKVLKSLFKVDKDVDNRILKYFREIDRDMEKGEGKHISFAEIQAELQDKFNLDSKKAQTLILNHYYLAPNNLKYSQLFLAVLSILMSLAIAVIQYGNDFFPILFSMFLGILIALPYLLLFILVRNLRNFKTFELFFLVGFLYTLLVSLVFIVICLGLKLYGAILIPAILLLFYFVELLKLGELKAKLADNEDD